MSQLSLATRLFLINSWFDAPVYFIQQNAPGSATNQTRLAPTVGNAALATSVFITGHGQYDLASLRYVRAVKPSNGTKHKVSVDPADPAQITVAANLVRGDVIVFKLNMETTDSRSEFASDDWKDSRYFAPFEYRCKGNDTAAQVVAGLFQQIDQIRTLFPEADGAGEPYKATLTGGVLTLEAADSHLTLNLYVDDIFIDNKDQVPVFAPVTVTPQFDGRGTYVILKNVFHETPGSNSEYAHSKRSGLPVRNTLYTNLLFGITTKRPDLSNQGAAGSVVFQDADFSFYIAETAANDEVLDALLTFFNRTTAPKEFQKTDGTPGTLADLVGAAIPVADPTTEDPTNN